MYRLIFVAAALLALAACQDPNAYGPSRNAALYNGGYGPSRNTALYGGTNGSALINSDNTPPSYGATPREQALQGCASGQGADFLHANRPGGTDYNPARCHYEGY
jgi:hypothetical protein